MSQVNLSEQDVRLLIQSLEHCLSTCKSQDPKHPKGICAQCDQAVKLRDRLSAEIKPS